MYKECKAKEIKYFPAIEFYYSDSENEKDNYHLCAFAKNNEGWKNLCRLSSKSYNAENFYRKPRINLNLLEQHKEGIIISTACAFSYPAQKIVNNELDKCNNFLMSVKSIFKEDFYLEIMDHGFEDEIKVKDYYRNFGDDNKIKVIGTSDTHYCLKTDQKFHGIFKNLAYCSGEGKDASFDGYDYHIYSLEEMQQKFTTQEIENTNEIADKCNVTFKHTEYHLPKFDIPNKEDDEFEYLSDICWKSLKQKGLANDKVYVDRLKYELNMLHMADLENYILIVQDYINWCKNNNIYVGPGRGSMAGSIVSWLSNITTVDPIKYNLLFERAINTGRVMQYKFFEGKQ